MTFLFREKKYHRLNTIWTNKVRVYSQYGPIQCFYLLLFGMGTANDFRIGICSQIPHVGEESNPHGMVRTAYTTK